MNHHIYHQEDAKARRDRSGQLGRKWLRRSMWFGVAQALLGLTLFFIAFPYPGRSFDHTQAAVGTALCVGGAVLVVVAEFLSETDA